MKEITLGIYGAYFTSTRTIFAVVLPLIAMLLLYLSFKRTRSHVVRSWSLGLMMLSSIFLWLFLGLSLVLCYASSEAYEYELQAAVADVFGHAILIAVVAGVPLALMLRQFSPRAILQKAKNLTVPNPAVTKSFEALRKRMKIPVADLRLSRMNVPISFAVDAAKPTIVMSESLLTLLKKDELEAVMAHELAHIKNSDTSLKALVTAYKTALPHDPIIRLVEAAFHREREMAADETAVKVTGRPLSLATALLKIYEAFPRRNLASYGTLSILGTGGTLMSRQPPIRQRINQLAMLAERKL